MDAPRHYLYTPGDAGHRNKPAELLDVVRCQDSAALLLPLPARLACSDAAGMKGSGAMKPSSMFYVHEADVAHIHHFLEECSLCGKSLSGDIFMYRGDTPFCSEECRQQQIEVDRAKHRRKKHAAAHAVSARKEHRHHHHHQHKQPQPQPRKAMDTNPWADAGFGTRGPPLRV